MAITYSSVGTPQEQTGTAALQPTCPATVNAGDILIAHVCYNNTNNAPATPSSWTLLSAATSNIGTTPNGRHWIYGKIADGSEDGTAVNFGTNASALLRWGVVYRFVGRVSGTIEELCPSASFSSEPHGTDPQAPSVTTTETGALAVACSCQNDNNTLETFAGESGGAWTLEFAQALANSDLALNTCTPTADPGTVSGGAMSVTNDPSGTIGFEIRTQPVAPNEGSATGGAEFAGSATGSMPARGAATGTADFAGSATGEAPAAGPNEGSTTGAVDFAGSATGSMPAGGTAAGSTDSTGSATGSMPARGAATGTADFAGSSTGSRSSAGSATGTADFAGSATGSMPTGESQGSATGTADFAGSATGSMPAGGAVTGTADFAGTAQGSRVSSGSATGTADFAGSAVGSNGEGSEPVIPDDLHLVAVSAPRSLAALADPHGIAALADPHTLTAMED